METDQPFRDQDGYEHRVARGVVRAHLLDFLVLGPLFIGLLVIAFFSNLRAGWFLLMFGAAVVVWAIAFSRQWRRFYRLRCPECRTMLKRKKEPEDTPIAFRCPHCMVVWSTGFIESDESGG